MKFKIFSKYFLLLVIFSTISSCSRLGNLRYEPNIPAENFCDLQPCVEIGQWTVSQPSSSVLVFLLGFFSLFLAFQFYKNKGTHQSRLYWALSMFLGGIGALLAGVSFQAFGYEIKCKGQMDCSWTSWWEIYYNICTVAAAGALLVAISYSLMGKLGQQRAKIYAGCSTLLYSIITLVGCMLPNKLLVSFEFMILFSLPTYFFIFYWNVKIYRIEKTPLLSTLIKSEVLLLLVFLCYSIYSALEITSLLWAKDIWFSDNDVLHLGMLGWLVFIYFKLKPLVLDAEFSNLGN
jgi:hypothetical protein